MPDSQGSKNSNRHQTVIQCFFTTNLQWNNDQPSSSSSKYSDMKNRTDSWERDGWDSTMLEGGATVSRIAPPCPTVTATLSCDLHPKGWPSQIQQYLVELYSVHDYEGLQTIFNCMPGARRRSHYRSYQCPKPCKPSSTLHQDGFRYTGHTSRIHCEQHPRARDSNTSVIRDSQRVRVRTRRQRDERYPPLIRVDSVRC